MVNSRKDASEEDGFYIATAEDPVLEEKLLEIADADILDLATADDSRYDPDLYAPQQQVIDVVFALSEQDALTLAKGMVGGPDYDVHRRWESDFDRLYESLTTKRLPHLIVLAYDAKKEAAAARQRLATRGQATSQASFPTALELCAAITQAKRELHNDHHAYPWLYIFGEGGISQLDGVRAGLKRYLPSSNLEGVVRDLNAVTRDIYGHNLDMARKMALKGYSPRS